MATRLTDFKVLTFDCYGTLIDWETGIWDALQPLIMANPGCNASRGELLETYAKIERAQETATPGMLYTDLLVRVHSELAAKLSMRSRSDLDQDFGRSIPHWPAFRDTAEALRAYAAHFHPRLEALRGSEAEVAEVIRSFQGYVNYVPQADGQDYLVDHTAYVYLMGPDGAYVTHFTAFDDETEMTERLARLAEN